MMIGEPNPKRVAAGRRNRAKRKPLSDEVRARLQAAIHERRPWEKSTGPQTTEGRAKSSRNAKRPPRDSLALQAELSVEREALQLLQSLRGLRSSLYIDPQSVQLQTGESIAEKLHSVLVASSRSTTSSLAQRLKDDVLGVKPDDATN